LHDVNQAFVGTDFKLLAGFSIDVGTSQNRVSFDPRGQGNWAVHHGPGPLRRIYDFMGRSVQHFMVVGLHPNADALVRKTRQTCPPRVAYALRVSKLKLLD